MGRSPASTGVKGRHGERQSTAYYRRVSPREPSVLVSWAPGRLLGLGSPILPTGCADTSERHGVSQLTVQDRDGPGPLKSQGKVHVPIL